MSANPPGGDEVIKHKKSSRSTTYLVVGVVVVVAALVGVAYAEGWIFHTAPATVGCSAPAGQTITGAGSSFVYPLMSTWTGTYTTSQLNYQSVGSGQGITDITNTQVVFGASDAPLSKSQAAGVKSTILTMPEAAGAAAVIYNISGLTLKMNGTFLADAYMGILTSWNNTILQKLNPGVTLPNQNIILVHRSDGSGTSYMFQQFLSKSSATWASLYGYATAWLGPTTIPGEQGAKGSSGVAGYVKGHAYTLSYVDLTYVLTTTGIQMAAVQNPAGQFITPSVNDTKSAIVTITSAAGFKLPAGTDTQGWQNVSMINSPGAGDYPISSFTYLLFYQAPDSAFGSSSTVMNQNVAKAFWVFLDWVVKANGGQQYSTGDFYVPIPASVTTADQATIMSMTWGGQGVYSSSCA